jgi:ATP-dependent DNA ligase
MVEHHLKDLAAGHSFRLDGEAVYLDPETGEPDYNFTARCLGSGTEVCIQKQAEVGHLTYFVFDILMLDNEDIRGRPLEFRKTVLRDLISFTGNVDPVLGDTPTYEQHIENFQHFKEGSVLKLTTSVYAGKRHKSWLKWKEVETVDGKIIGYKDGQGKFMGLIGAIKFITSDGTVGFCSGMTDEDRIFISDHRVDLLGKIIEVKHFGRLVDGYRHPQFIRFREDK